VSISRISRNGAVRAVALLALPLTLAACGTSGGADAAAGGAPSPSPVSSAEAAQAGAQLSKEILPVPSGATAWSKAPTGVLDQTTVIHEFFGQKDWDTETARTSRRGFVSAVRHAWTNQDGTACDVLLIQFATGAGADSMAEGMSEGWKLALDGTGFSDPDVHGSGFIANKPDQDGYVATELVATHRTVLAYVSYFAAGKPDQTTAEKLIKEQVNALSGV
jgi:hypothetical protein